jgi:hypothetical protein
VGQQLQELQEAQEQKARDELIKKFTNMTPEEWAYESRTAYNQLQQEKQRNREEAAWCLCAGSVRQKYSKSIVSAFGERSVLARLCRDAISKAAKECLVTKDVGDSSMLLEKLDIRFPIISKAPSVMYYAEAITEKHGDWTKLLEDGDYISKLLSTKEMDDEETRFFENTRGIEDTLRRALAVNKETPNLADLLDLLNGVRLTDTQREIAGHLLGIRIDSPCGCYDDCFFFRRNTNKYLLTGKGQLRSLDTCLDIQTYAAELLGCNARIFMSDTITEQEAGALHDVGILFVGHIRNLRVMGVDVPRPKKVVLIGSTDKEVAKKMYDDQPVSGLQAAIRHLQRLPPATVTVIDHISTLQQVVKTSEHALIVCHNSKDGMVRFADGTMSFSQLAKLGDVLSCDTYDLQKALLRSTGSLRVDDLCEAIADAWIETDSYEQFIRRMTATYAKRQSSRSRKRLVLSVWGTPTVIVGPACRFVFRFLSAGPPPEPDKEKMSEQEKVHIKETQP